MNLFKTGFKNNNRIEKCKNMHLYITHVKNDELNKYDIKIRIYRNI